MQKITDKNKMVIQEGYLVETGYGFSSTGFDIAIYEGLGRLISQSNGDNVITLALNIYTLPDMD